MKFSYLVVAFFLVFAWFSCTEEHAVDTTTDFQLVVDTIITFDPETYEESIQTITYKISTDGKDTLDTTIEHLGNNQLEETITIVRNEETDVVDTIITVTFPE